MQGMWAVKRQQKTYNNVFVSNTYCNRAVYKYIQIVGSVNSNELWVNMPVSKKKNNNRKLFCLSVYSKWFKTNVSFNLIHCLTLLYS